MVSSSAHLLLRGLTIVLQLGQIPLHERQALQSTQSEQFPAYTPQPIRVQGFVLLRSGGPNPRHLVGRRARMCPGDFEFLQERNFTYVLGSSSFAPFPFPQDP